MTISLFPWWRMSLMPVPVHSAQHAPGDCSRTSVYYCKDLWPPALKRDPASKRHGGYSRQYGIFLIAGMHCLWVEQISEVVLLAGQASWCVPWQSIMVCLLVFLACRCRSFPRWERSFRQDNGELWTIMVKTFAGILPWHKFEIKKYRACVSRWAVADMSKGFPLLTN